MLTLQSHRRLCCRAAQTTFFTDVRRAARVRSLQRSTRIAISTVVLTVCTVFQLIHNTPRQRGGRCLVTASPLSCDSVSPHQAGALRCPQNYTVAKRDAFDSGRGAATSCRQSTSACGVLHSSHCRPVTAFTSSLRSE